MPVKKILKSYIDVADDCWRQFKIMKIQCIKNVARPYHILCRRANEQKIFLVFGFLPMASSSITNLFKNKKPILSGVDHASSDFSKNKTILNISTEMKKV